MSGPWEQYAAQADGPWTLYGGKSDPATRTSVSPDEMRQLAYGGKPPLSDTLIDTGKAGLASGLRTAGGYVQQVEQTVANMTPAGVLMTTVAPAVVAKMKPGLGKAVAGVVTNALQPSNPAQMIPGADYQAHSLPGKIAEQVVPFIPAALSPGNALERTASVVLPAAGSYGAGKLAEATGANERTQRLAQLAGGMAGSVVAVVHAPATSPTSQADVALDKFAQKARPDIPAMQARAQEFRDVGIDPTLTDITDESGRGVLRAASSRMTPGRQVAQDFGDQRALDLPDRLGAQAKAVMSADPRTPMQIASELAASRNAEADTAFGAVRNDLVTISPEDAQLFHIPDVKAAVGDALRRERDPEARAALSRLFNASDSEGSALAAQPNEAVSPHQLTLYHGSPKADLTELQPTARAGTFDFPPVVSLATDPAVAREYAGAGGRVYQANITAPIVGDFRDPTHVQSVIDFYKNQSSANPLHQFTSYDTQAIKHGSWRLWENPELWRQQGWDGAWVREEPGASGDGAINLSLASGDGVKLGGAPAHQSPGAPAPPELTVGNVDRISRVLLSKAQGLWSSDSDLATTLAKYGNALRDAAKAQSTGYADALDGYAHASSLMDSAGRGEDFLKRNTDEFVTDTGAMSPDQLALARATGRRAVERAAGENVSAAPGVARRLATAPEQKARNAALLGPDAERLQQGMALEEQAVQNARDIAPKTGSQTTPRLQDAAETAAGGVKVLSRAGRGDFLGSAIETAKLWLKSRGLNDAQAEELVRIATTPGRTDEAVNALARITGKPAATRFARRFGGTLTSAATRQIPALSAVAVAPNALAPQRQRQ